jgi:5-methylcytosine-specific restriction endonuclease McrA
VLHVDHVVPLAAGGTTSEGNLRTACEECNLGKGVRTFVASDR